MSIPSQSKEALKLFLQHLEIERNLSLLTIRNYSFYLNFFISWLEDEKSVNDLIKFDADSLRDYRLFLARYQNSRGELLSKKTQTFYLIALRSLLKWLIRNDLTVLNPEKIDLPKSDSIHMKYSPVEGILKMMEMTDIAEDAGLRDRVALEILFSTGLRVSELVSLNRDQINLERKEFGIIGKGRRHRVVFLSEQACHFLDLYLKRRKDHFKPLLIRMDRRSKNILAEDDFMRLTARSVQRIVDKYCRLAHLPVKLSPHGIRHSFATDLLFNGANLRDVQEMLGHKSIVTTQIYTHVTKPHLKKIYQRFHFNKEKKE
jgi:site-specific recombinase XerD